MVHWFNLFCPVFRKGKTKPLDLIERDKTGRFVNLFVNMGEEEDDVDLHAASEFVCHIYGQQKTKDVNEARYNKLKEMTGRVDEVRKA